MKKNILRSAVMFMMVLLVSAASAEGFLSANDLKAKELTENLIVDEVFTITATPEKGTSILKSQAYTAPDGEIFNRRIKLGGAGSDTFRSVVFKTTGKTELSVYLNSTSKVDTRLLRVVSLADGSELGTIPALPDDSKNTGLETFSIPAAGEYYLTSKSGGINIFAVYFD